MNNKPNVFGNTSIGSNCIISNNVMLGYPDSSILNEIIKKNLEIEEYKYEGVVIGDNAFKIYKRETIEGLKPFLAPHFNLTIELPLKVIIRGYSYAVVPNSWTNRKYGTSNLKIREMVIAGNRKHIA